MNKKTKDIIDDIISQSPIESVIIKNKRPVCEKCDKDQLVVDRWARRTAPNQYKLYDRIICKNCQTVKVQELVQLDKNTDATRKILMDLKMGMVGKDYQRNKKSPVKEEIDVNSLFPD